MNQGLGQHRIQSDDKSASEKAKLTGVEGSVGSSKRHWTCRFVQVMNCKSGSENLSGKRIAVPVLFSYHLPCDSVVVSGSFDGWKARVPLLQITESPYSLHSLPRPKGRYTTLVLPPGRYEFKFLVSNGSCPPQWVTRDDLPTERDASVALTSSSA